MGETNVMPAAALDGIKILEWSHRITGQFTTKLMADLGADVIKVEPPTGNPARRHGPFPQDVPHAERSGLFLNANTNKRGVTLNVDSPSGRQLFFELVQRVDVLIEDHHPRDVEALGLTYAVLSDLHPRLIMTSITPYGQTGPHRHHRGNHLTAFHSSGQGYMLPPGTELMTRPPTVAGVYGGDYQCAFGAATATLGAVMWGQTSEKGQHVDVSEQEWGMGLASLFLTRYPFDGFVESRQTQKFPFLGKLPCRDGYVMIMAPEERHWEQFVEMVGRAEWARDERFANADLRRQHGELLNARVTTWLQDKTRREVLELSMAHGVPCGYVATAEDVLASPQLQSRGFFQSLDHPEAGHLPYATAPYRMSETPVTLKRAAPRLGEHNVEVYGELGYDRADLAAWRRGGII